VRSQLPRGGKLALYGFGSSAHVVLQIARHRGCEVYVATRGQQHRELARQMGAVWVGEHPAEMDYHRCVFYERDIHSVTCNTREDGRALLAEAAEIPIRPHTTAYPLWEANRALQDLKNDRISGTGVLVVKDEE